MLQHRRWALLGYVTSPGVISPVAFVAAPLVLLAHGTFPSSLLPTSGRRDGKRWRVDTFVGCLMRGKLPAKYRKREPRCLSDMATCAGNGQVQAKSFLARRRMTRQSNDTAHNMGRKNFLSTKKRKRETRVCAN